MLVVHRRVGQRIMVGAGIEIVITDIGSRSVRVGIVAPRGVLVLRGEVHDAIARANAVAAEIEIETAEPAPGFSPCVMKEA